MAGVVSESGSKADWAWGAVEAGSATGVPPAELARQISSTLLVAGLVIIVLLGLAAIVLVMLMGGRLRRQVRDELPPVVPPDAMWPLQVPPVARENTEELDDGELEDRGEGRE